MLRHFKMESIQNVLNVIKKDAFMASIDLKNIFYFKKCILLKSI